MNSYNVTFVYETTVITSTVFALNEDVAVSIAADQIIDDVGINYASVLTDGAEQITVELLDENVLEG